jgi:hypothetical protein
MFQIGVGIEGGQQFLNTVKLVGDLGNFLELGVNEGNFVSSGKYINDFGVFLDNFFDAFDCVNSKIHLRELSLCNLLTTSLMPSLTSLISTSLNSSVSPRSFSIVWIRSSRCAKYYLIMIDIKLSEQKKSR